jgi:outer membrane protein TolC
MLLAPPLEGRSETLSEAWTAALQSDRRLFAVAAERDAANYEFGSARAERNPRLDLVSSFTQLDSAPRFAFGDSFVSPKIFSGDNFFSTGAQVSLPLFTGGLISSNIGAAKSAANASQWQVETVIQNVMLDVAERYIDVLRAESAVMVAGSNVAMLANHSEDAQWQYQFGAVPKNDFLAASVSLANARQGELKATNRLDLARAAYNRLLGRPLTNPVTLDPALLPLTASGKDFQSLTRLAVENRHELAGLAARAEALRNQSAAEQARLRPQLALTGGYTLLENEVLDDDRFWSVGVALQWNVFDGGRTKKRAAARSHEAKAVMHQRADLESVIVLQVRKSWLDCKEAESRKVVAAAAVEQATENLRVARNRYKAGAGTNTEVLDAEALRAQSLSNRNNARFDAALASVRLTRAIGTLDGGV